MEPKTRKQGKWNPSRVVKAFSRIGYNPVAALLDIADNSVSNGAHNVAININLANAPSQGRGRPKAVISSFSIIDDGIGMDEEGIDNALSLGSDENLYSNDTLSKFGMGLKSAAFSLGDCLEVITRKEGGKVVRKAVLDYKELGRSNDSFFYTMMDPSEEDVKEFEAHCGESSGTIIRIADVHVDSLPPLSDIIDPLRDRIGIVYYYYLSGKIPGRDPIAITVNSDHVTALDPLFESEASEDLDENSWNGLEVKWITRPRKIPLDVGNQSRADIAITQLPHPPSAEIDNPGRRKEVREAYKISANNYGFYIYRNYRLISWADSLDGLVSPAKNLYGFRGRILIESNADDLLNIDVTKSRIKLSEIARDNLRAYVGEALKKSRNAWDRRTEIVENPGGTAPHTVVNELLDDIEKQLSKDDERNEEVAPPNERRMLEGRRKRASQTRPAKTTEIQRLNEYGERVQYINHLDNNQLWERAHDPSNMLFVRVNQSHRFFRDIFAGKKDNSDLVQTLDILFFALARGEYNLIYQTDIKNVDQIMQEYRERVGEALSEIVRRITIKLPDTDE